MGERFFPEAGEQIELVREAEALAGERFMPDENVDVQPLSTPQKNFSYYLEEEDRVIDAPPGMQEKEITFQDEMQNKPDSDVSQFFGFNKIYQKTADVVALPFKGAIATAINLGATGEAGGRAKEADAIKQGMEEDMDALRQKAARGGKLSDEEARILLRDINDFNNPIAFLFTKIEDRVRRKAKKAVEKGDQEKITAFERKEKNLRDSVGAIRKNADELIEKHFARPEKEDSVLAERILYDFGGVTTTIGASIGLAYVTKNPIASATLFSTLQDSAIYLEARDSGAGIEKSKAKADLAGKVEGALEFVGVNYFFKIAENSKGVAKHLLRMGEEALQEFLQSGSESAITQSSGIREVDVAGALKEAAYAAFLGSLGGGTTSIAMDKLSKRVEEQTGGALSAEMASLFLERVHAEAGTLEGILAQEIEDDASGLKSQADMAATEKALSYLDDFVNGRPIDISKMDRSTYEALKEMRDEHTDRRVEELEAQAQSNFLAVPKKPQSLSGFLKERGGLKADTIEAQRFTRKESPALKGVANKNGTLSLDEALELAVEAGFFPEPDPNNPTEISINDLLEALEAEASGVAVVAAADQEAVDARNAILEFNEQRDVANQEIMENAREVKSMKQAFKLGIRAAKKDVKAAQEAAIEFVEENLPDGEDRAKFIKAIKNIDSAEKLRKAAPDFERRIERILTGKLLAQQKKRVKTLLSKKKLKAVIQAGKKKGKFGSAETQRRLEYLQELYNTSGKVNEEIGRSDAAEMLETFQEADVPDPLANAILQMKATPREVSPQFVARIADSIEAIQTFGLEEAERRLHTRHQEAKDIRDDIEHTIDPQGDLLTKKKRAGVRKAAREGVAWAVEAWEDYIDRILPAESAGRLEVGEEVAKGNAIVRVMQEKLVAVAQEIYGGTAKELNTMLDESHVEHDLGVYENMRGEQERIEISKAQARKLWMEYQSETIRENTLQSENGNAYTDTMLRDMFAILDPVDFQFAEAQLDIYEEFYDQINEVYSRVFGIDLPRNDFYSPIAREIDLTEENTDIFGTEMKFRKQLAAGTAIKLRDKKAVSALARRSDLQVFNSHIIEMAHFIAFREKTMLLQDVFGDAKLRRKIDAKFGKEYLKNVDQIRERIAGGGVQAANTADKIVNYLNRNFATSVLGGKAKIGVTQLSSYFAYGEFLQGGTLEAGAALVDGSRHFVANYSNAVALMASAEFMQNRGYSPEVDIQRMGETFTNEFLRKTQKKKENLIDYTLIFTKLGDRGAIYFGGWSVYRQSAIGQLMSEGLSQEEASNKFDADLKAGTSAAQSYHAEALSKFQRASKKTQQSKDVDQVSLMQSEKALYRTLTMFQSAPFAQFRGEVRAFRQYFFKKEITGAEFGKRFLIYHVLIPQFYRALSNGLLFGEFDEEDQMATLFLGSLNAIPLFSDILNFIIREARGKPTRNGGLLKWAPMMYEAVDDGLNALLYGGEGDFELAVEYLADTGKDVGSLVGFMVPQVEQAMEGVEDIEFGDTKQGIMKIFGHSDEAAEGD